jgi:uncharacterized protein (UPF0335 family)
MPDILPPLRQALELRYDGPIPPQHLDHAQARRRRLRGSMALLESQATQFLDAAERCQGEIEDLATDLADLSKDAAAQKLQAKAARCNAHIRAAAEALGQAISLRQALGLAPHPLVALLDLLPNTANGNP